jgi:hypothetical protein
VVLHGSNGNAYKKLVQFIPTAKQTNISIISIQWARPGGNVTSKSKQGLVASGSYYAYLSPAKTYELMGLALNFLAVHYGTEGSKAAWYGYDRAANHCVAYAFMDRIRGGNFFSLFIAAAPNSIENLPELDDIKPPQSGDNSLSGKQFYLWCGNQDKNGCDRMHVIEEQIKSLDGTILAIIEADEPKNGFNENQNYQTKALKTWR